MNNISLSQLASVSDLQRNYSFLIAKVKKMAKPLILLRRNEPEAVLVSLPHYEDLIEAKRLYEEQVAFKAIEEFEKDRKAGKLLVANSPDDLFK